jgi:putative oxidoreductase
MSAVTLLHRAQARALAVTRSLDGVAPLLARVTLGVTFAGTGWGKLQHLEKVTMYFTQLGLPAPHFQAALVGAVELVGGVLLLVGFASRLASLPLLVTMVVAIATAKRADISGVSDLLGMIEWTYLVLLAWLALGGPGRFSVDGLRALFATRRDSKASAPTSVAARRDLRLAEPFVSAPSPSANQRTTRP